MLNIVISILKPKVLAVILGRWNLAEARKYMPEGRVDKGEGKNGGMRQPCLCPLGRFSPGVPGHSRKICLLLCLRVGFWNPLARVLLTFEILPWMAAREWGGAEGCANFSGLHFHGDWASK